MTRLVRTVSRFLTSTALLAPAFAAAAAPQWLPPTLRDPPLAGTIVNAQGEKVPESELLSALASARLAFIGEKHDNPDHHQIELRLIKHRLAHQAGSAVVFEMLDDAQRPLLGSLTSVGANNLTSIEISYYDIGIDKGAGGLWTQ